MHSAGGIMRKIIFALAYTQYNFIKYGVFFTYHDHGIHFYSLLVFIMIVIVASAYAQC